MKSNLKNSPGIETTHPIRSSETGWKQLGEYTWNWNNSPNKKFRKRWKTTWRIHLELKQLALFLNFLLGELFQFQVSSSSYFSPVSEHLIGWVVSIPGVFSKLFSTCFWTSYWASCFNSRCILQVVFHLFLNFLLGELFQFQVYSPSCFQPVSELLIGRVVSIPDVFSKLFSTSFWTSYWVSCFNSSSILQVVFNLFLKFLLGELFQFQMYSPSCFPPVSELLIGWVVSEYTWNRNNSPCFWTSYWASCFNSRCILQVVFHLFLNFLLGELFQFQEYSPSCFQPVSEHLIGVSCFNSRSILQVVFHLFLNFLLGELFQFQVYSPSCFPPVSELLIGWVVSIPGVFSKLFSTNKKFRNRWKTTWGIHLELKQLTQ